VDTGIFFITTNQKIEGSKRNLKINSKSYRIECMNDTEIKNYKTIWRETGIKKQENLINLDGNKKITNHREIVEEDYRLLLKSKKKDVEKVIVKGSNEKKEQVINEVDNTLSKSTNSLIEDKTLHKGKNLQKEKESSGKNNNTLNSLKQNHVIIKNDDTVPEIVKTIQTQTIKPTTPQTIKPISARRIPRFTKPQIRLVDIRRDERKWLEALANEEENNSDSEDSSDSSWDVILSNIEKRKFGTSNMKTNTNTKNKVKKK